MALNPPLLHTGVPAPLDGEYLVLSREGMEAEIKIENDQKYKGKGNLYLTTARMVFVNKKQGASWKAFDIPIAYMYEEKFNQPIFGANYVSCGVQPLYDLIPGHARVKIWFMKGGCGTFLPLWRGITRQIRQNNNQGPDPEFVNEIRQGNLENIAYVDPNDPSRIFVSQPASEMGNGGFQQQQQQGNHGAYMQQGDYNQSYGGNQQNYGNQGSYGQNQQQQQGGYYGQPQGGNQFVAQGVPVQNSNNSGYNGGGNMNQVQGQYQQQNQGNMMAGNQGQYQQQQHNQGMMMGGQQQGQGQNQQQQQQNVGYYFGYQFGPTLQRNR